LRSSVFALMHPSNGHTMHPVNCPISRNSSYSATQLDNKKISKNKKKNNTNKNKNKHKHKQTQNKNKHKNKKQKQTQKKTNTKTKNKHKNKIKRTCHCSILLDHQTYIHAIGSKQCNILNDQYLKQNSIKEVKKDT
jgi:hypothetical protein